ncbi:hypothetical protein [Saccharothrix texasensis]|uniref:hypothetical protein n=1 Tax=Saccharothrix texasensis TaxID=103734 RepID=UPI000F4C086B|nr:hypothetical protein [Saccharothrix texasensis]
MPLTTATASAGSPDSAPPPVTAVSEPDGVHTWTTTAPRADLSAAAGPYTCFAGHSQDIGWPAQYKCSYDGTWAQAGVIGQHKQLEAVQLYSGSTGGQTCGQAHLRDIGWVPANGYLCVSDGAVAGFGTVGENRPIEAFRFFHRTRQTCSQAHLLVYGPVDDYVCPHANTVITVGTVGEAKALEALTGTIL